MSGAQLKLIASPGTRAALLELAPQFEKATGHKVIMDFAVIAVLKRRIAAGEAFDVVIPGPELIDELVGQGKVAADTRAPFGKTGVGLGVKRGVPKPDISKPESLKRALLAAKAVGHSREGQSGVAFVEALKRLGIEEEMRPKIRTYELRDQAIALQHGEINIAASGMGPMIEMPGAELLGGLPPGLQSYVKFSIGVSADSKAPEAARELQRFLISPAVIPVFKSKGLERFE
ncbi:MAG TPA: substrate-binding domain-containing protein [Burkholderiales bacterium]|nr:substrate-binding domain-containing protein [Burkholderiales bacterium]